MSVNIWVTAPDGERITLCWGVGMVPDYHEKHGRTIFYVNGDNAFPVSETAAEIAALIAAEQRKRDRLMLAGRALQGYLANPNISRWLPHEIAGQAVQSADALLAALDKEGE